MRIVPPYGIVADPGHDERTVVRVKKQILRLIQSAGIRSDKIAQVSTVQLIVLDGMGVPATDVDLLLCLCRQDLDNGKHQEKQQGFHVISGFGKKLSASSKIMALLHLKQKIMCQITICDRY